MARAEASGSTIDRMMRRVLPAAVQSFTPPPRAVADGIWLVDRQLTLPGAMILPTRMVVFRLADGTLALHSPVQLDAALTSQLSAIGTVAAIIAPNSFHHVFAPAWAAAFPSARLFATPGLRERVATFPAAEELSDEPPALWSDVLAQRVFGPIRGTSEVVFLHRSSGTLVITDLAFNMREIAGGWQRVAWRLFGVPPRFGPSRTARLLLLRDRQRVGAFIRVVLEWPFERIVVAHGDLVEDDARGELERAFSGYLTTKTPRHQEPPT